MVAYLNMGEMEKIDALQGFIAGAYTNLVIWLGWLEKGDKDKADPYLKKAIEQFGASYDETKKIAALLEKPVGKISQSLYNLDILPEDKRVLYVVFARMYPGEQKTLLRWAELMNFSLTYPHHFLEKTIKRMKQ